MSDTEVIERTHEIDGVRVIFQQHKSGSYSWHIGRGNTLCNEVIAGSIRSFEQYIEDALEAKPWITGGLV